MKPVKLEFCGINSFSEPQTIEFETLMAYGLFGIFGDTGSGKSSILDCISFALYGDVLRARSSKISDIINYNCDRAYVNFEFDIDYAGKRRRYRVERELKLKNASQNLKVYEYDEGKGAYLCVADAVRQGDRLLGEVIGLEQKDYEKCIALPQGEFAQFVKSGRADRLKLIARLFDLERFGEGLVKRVNLAVKDASAAVELSKAKLQPYESISKEGIDGLKTQIAAQKKEADVLKSKLADFKEREKKLAALLEKSKEAKVFREKYLTLQAQLSEIELLERELGLLPLATAVKKAHDALTKAEDELRNAELARKGAEGKLASAKNEVALAQAWDSEKSEAELAALNEERVRADAREKSVKRVKELEDKLKSSREEYKKCKDRFGGFDYEKEKAAIEARIASIQKGDALGLSKEAFFREEYAQFKEELCSIEHKFPETEGEIAPLIAKYTALSQGKVLDFSLLEGKNAEREKLLKTENEALRALEERNGDYKAHLMQLKAIEEEGKRIKEEIESLKKEMGEGASLIEIDRKIALLKKEAKAHTEKLDTAKKALSAAEANYAVCEEREKTCKKLLNEARAHALEALQAGAFESAKAAIALIDRYGEEEGAKERVKKFREEFSAAKAGYENLKDLPAVDEHEVEELKLALQETEKENENCVTLLALKKDELARSESALKEKSALEKELNANEKEKGVCEQLKKILEGNKFMEFVAEEYLGTVTLNASGRLLTLTNGQYFLKYDGGFLVGDNLYGGALRAVNMMSGGEIFLVSLSLALALSQEICARNLRSSEFFFLDEGFGTLDSKLVDTVMDSLEKLKGENFSIGIISHVEELKHRINRKLTVKKATAQHGSQIISE